MRNDTNSRTRPFSAPNLNTRGIDILPKIREITHATSVKNRSSPIPTMSSTILCVIRPPIKPIISPKRLPMAQKIASTINFPATNSFLETGIIIAYRVHLELSSKEKVVTIIMLHKIAHTKI